MDKPDEFADAITTLFLYALALRRLVEDHERVELPEIVRRCVKTALAAQAGDPEASDVLAGAVESLLTRAAQIEGRTAVVN
ncbi:MAG: hypothetical protein OXC93_03695 [Rhodospirillaceae bacterium]|nr:hypothetical protein [Rhodospirillaceae bacterium]